MEELHSEVLCMQSLNCCTAQVSAPGKASRSCQERHLWVDVSAPG